MDDATITSIPFRLNDLDGEVAVEYGVNEDPMRWGYGLLGLAYPTEVARGFPVVQATVSYPGEGYGAYMGWLQIVRYRVGGRGEEILVFDVAPQLSEADTPYLSYGLRPAMFDAPSITDPDVTWKADSFLVHTPDALMTRVIHGLCGFTWGYAVAHGKVRPDPLTITTEMEWQRNLVDLGSRYPTWSFGSSWSSLDPPPDR
jgi:hypothetical protein